MATWLAAAAEPASQKLKVSFLEAARGGKHRVALSDGRDVEVAIPAGIEAGQKLRIKDPRLGEKFLEIEIEPHPLFTSFLSAAVHRSRLV